MAWTALELAKLLIDHVIDTGHDVNVTSDQYGEESDIEVGIVGCTVCINIKDPEDEEETDEE